MPAETIIQLRQGTASQWAAANGGLGPVLASGEVGFETDTFRFKIGNGSSAYNSLQYPNQGIASTTTLSTTAIPSTFTSATGLNKIAPLSSATAGYVKIASDGTLSSVNETYLSVSATSLPSGVLASSLTSVGTLTGLSLSGALNLRSGSTGAGTAPIYFGTTSPGLLSTQVKGALEYDGNELYFTPETSAGRGFIPTSYFNSISYFPAVSTNTTTAQNMFTSSITLPSGTYEIEIVASVVYVQSASSTALELSFPNQVNGIIISGDTLAALGTTVKQVNSTTIQFYSNSTSVNRTVNFLLKGTFSASSSVSNFMPKIRATTTATSSWQTQPNTYMKLTRIGDSGLNTVGNWV